MIFLNKHNYPIGFDVSDLSLKVIQLKKVGRTIKIKAMGRTAIPAGLIEGGEIKDKEKVIKIIKDLIDNPEIGKINSKEAVVCLPESKTFLKLLEIDKSNENLEEIIKVELEKNIPLQADEIYYDWQLIKDLPKKHLVLIGAAPRDIVDTYIEVFEKAKLSVVALEPEPISICRSILPEENMKYKEEQDNYGVIDIGACNASISVYAENTIIFTASLPISGEEITEKIAEALNITKEVAEKGKIIYSLEEAKEERAEVSEILSDMVENLSQKIISAINFYDKNHASWGKINKLFLCGGGANFKNLEKILSIKTGIETVRGDALINLGTEKEKFLHFFQQTYSVNANLASSDKTKRKKSKVIQISQDLSPTFATTIGLALRGIFIKDF